MNNLNMKDVVLQYKQGLDILGLEKRSDIQFMLEKIKEFPQSIEIISDELENNKDFIIMAVDNNAECFKYLSETYKDDLFIACQALMKDIKLIKFMGYTLKNDKKLAMTLIKNYPREDILLNMSSSLGDDKDFMSLVAKHNWVTVKSISPRLRKDKDFVLSLMPYSKGAAMDFFPEYRTEDVLNELWKNELYYAFLSSSNFIDTDEKINTIVEKCPEILYIIRTGWCKEDKNANKILKLLKESDDRLVLKSAIFLLYENKNLRKEMIKFGEVENIVNVDIDKKSLFDYILNNIEKFKEVEIIKENKEAENVKEYTTSTKFNKV